MTTFNRENLILGTPAVSSMGEPPHDSRATFDAPATFGAPQGRVLETITQRNATRSALKKGFKKHMRTGYLGDKAAISFFKACERRRKGKKP